MRRFIQRLPITKLIVLFAAMAISGPDGPYSRNQTSNIGGPGCLLTVISTSDIDIDSTHATYGCIRQRDYAIGLVARMQTASTHIMCSKSMHLYLHLNTSSGYHMDLCDDEKSPPLSVTLSTVSIRQFTSARGGIIDIDNRC